MIGLGDEHRIKRRRRPAKACDACRARKLRCDQRSPCGSCRRARSAPECVYGADTIRLPSPGPSPDSGSGATSLAHTPEQVRSFAPAGETELLRRQIAQLQNRVDNLESRVVQGSYPQDATPNAASHAAPMQCKLRQVPDKNKLFGTNHWIHALKHISAGTVDMKEVEIHFEAPKLDFARMRQVCSKLRQTIKQFEVPALNEPVPDILATLPTRSECDALVGIYMTTYERMYRILHMPSFYKEYDAFWLDQASSSTAFRMKLILILALSVILNDNGTEPALANRQSRTWLYAAQWWLTGPTEKSTFNLEGVQVACLLQLARQMTAAGRAWISSGSLLQMAFSVGLHRDPSHFQAMSPFQAEMQRRLWATALELNLMAAMDSPMHLSIDLDSYDTKPPANVSDRDIGPDDDSPVASQPDTILTDTSLQRFLLKHLPERVEVIRRLNSVRGLDYAETIDLANRIKSSCTQLTQLFDTHSSSPLLTKFHHHLLDIHFRLHTLRLHRHLFLRKPDDASSYLARKVCVDAAMAIASHAPSSPPPSDDIDLDRHHRLSVNTTGATKCPISLEIITILALEIRMQLVEQGSAGRANHVARAAREPMFTAMKNITDLLLHQMKLGSPRCKAYGLAAFITAQLRGQERGENPAQALSRIAEEDFANVQSHLEASVERLYASSAGGNVAMTDFDLDALLAMDFTGDDAFDLRNFVVGDIMGQ